MRESINSSRAFFPDLDASRFLAFILVFLFHAIKTSDSNFQSESSYQFIRSHLEVAHMGVDYFFTLSSFLISYLLLLELKTKKSIRIGAYLMRRILRIWPLYFFVLLLGFILIPQFTTLFSPNAELSLPPALPFVLFIANFYMMEHGVAFLFVLSILWTISVEEQFYLIWPFLCKMGSKAFPLVCTVFILLSVGSGFFIEPSKAYFHSLTYFANFGVGGLAAYLVVYKTEWIAQFEKLSKSKIIFVYLILLIASILYPYWRAIPFLSQLEQVVFACLFSFFILEQSFSKNSLFKMRNLSFWSKMGKMSYGLYVYEALGITTVTFLVDRYVTESYFGFFVFKPVLAFVLTLIIAILSYRTIESFFLRLKKPYRVV